MNGMCPLAESFLAHCARSADLEALEQALGALVDAGRAAWPALPREPDTFLQHLARHAPAQGDLLGYLASIRAGDLWLASACARGDARALALFDQNYLAGMSSFLARANQPSDAAEEVRQLLRQRLFVAEREGAPPRISSYSGRGELASWVRVAALRLAATLHHRVKDHAQFSERDVPADLTAHDVEFQLLQNRHGAAVSVALRDAFIALPAPRRALLRLHFLDGLNLERLGVVFNVSRATAGRMMLSAREQVLQDTLALLRQRLRLGPAELESLLGALRSKLDLSLQTLLREP